MVQSTHDVTLAADHVVKRFRSFDRDEPDREWAALVLLHEHARGLAPAPLERRTTDGAPEIVMSHLPGDPLGDAPLTGEQVAAVAAALRALHAVPLTGADLPLRRSGPAEMVAELRGWIDEPRAEVDAGVAAALEEARAWLHGEEAARLAGPLAEEVFTLADGNLANLLWDGECCRVVDFEDAGRSDPAYELADLLEHVTVWLRGLVDADELVAAMGFTAEQRQRLRGFRAVLAVFWLMMLLPGNPGHHRNPPDSLARQAARVRDLLGDGPSEGVAAPSGPPHPNG